MPSVQKLLLVLVVLGKLLQALLQVGSFVQDQFNVAFAFERQRVQVNAGAQEHLALDGHLLRLHQQDGLRHLGTIPMEEAEDVHMHGRLSVASNDYKSGYTFESGENSFNI